MSNIPVTTPTQAVGGGHLWGMMPVSAGHSVGCGGRCGSCGKCPDPSGPTAVKEAAVQRKHNLYRDSVVMHNSDPNLHLLAEGAPVDWGEEYGGGSGNGGGPRPAVPEAAPTSEKQRRAKQVVSMVRDEEAGPPFEAGPELLSPASPDSVTELRGLLAQDLRVESPPPAGPLLNGAPAQESARPAATPEASPPASPLQQLSPGKAADLEPPKPSDQETGEQVSSPGGRPAIHTTTEDSAGVQTEF